MDHPDRFRHDVPSSRPHAARSRRGPGLLAAALGLSALLAGCTAPLNARKDAVFQSYGYAENRPTVRPVRSISSFSDSLMCMDRLLRETGMPTILITSKQLPDYSGRVAVATKEMVITALSQMSRLSNAFRYVDYEVDIARQDTVQNLTTILLNNNQMQLQRPALYISGAISFVDQNVLRNDFDVGTSASRLETGYSRNRNATVIGLEMHLGEFRNRTLIPGLDSANEVIIGNGGQGLDLAGRIGSYGVQFTVGRDYAQGSGPAVRTLVELGMIELLGKWARVPYWQCLTLEQTHPDFQRQLRDWYEESGPDARQQLVQRSLIRKGYLPLSSQVLSPQSGALRTALARFQADQGMVVTGVTDFSTYERALSGFVGVGPDGKLTRIGWASANGRSLALPGQAGAGGAGLAVAERMIDMQIENISLDRSTFEVGEQIFVSATVSRTSFMSCYMSSAQGTVIRLLPNSTNPSGWVSANQAVRIPDWMSPYPGFLMDAGSPGSEGVACYATGNDIGKQLPAAFQVAPFQPMAGIRTLDDVTAAMQKAAGADGFSTQRLMWQVVPRRAAPAGVPPAAPAAR
ncbi:DUF4384 domain-containing protein [Pantoea sp. 18069]|uniref:DUF4384 domain-containing protein n=1 Tax=Pantoea sp. 18069 TaxID=2681415 RepID=UPI00135AFDD4|nr:DUF4384 domain-containing protein [Pantoea sp. 18069]